MAKEKQIKISGVLNMEEIKYVTNFEKSREKKIGIRERQPAGFSARMGNILEPIVLCEFMKDSTNGIFNETLTTIFFKNYIDFKSVKEILKGVNSEKHNPTPFKHHTEATTSFGVAHADCVYVPPPEAIESTQKKLSNAITVDFSKPFLIQAKTAQYWATKRNENDEFSGYDFNIAGWQGIPLKHYFQMQYEMALYDVDVSYLALLYNTSEKHYWQIKANKKHQADLLEIAEKMKKHIDKRTPPREFAMNTADIRKLYPEIKEDFTELSGDELSKAVLIVGEYRQAAEQEKTWKRKKEDAEDAMSILLKDNRKIMGLIGDKLQTIAVWKKTGGYDMIKALLVIKENHPEVLKYLIKKNMIVQANSSENPDIKLKLREDE
jgi:hypothetical protein